MLSKGQQLRTPLIDGKRLRRLLSPLVPLAAFGWARAESTTTSTAATVAGALPVALRAVTREPINPTRRLLLDPCAADLERPSAPPPAGAASIASPVCRFSTSEERRPLEVTSSTLPHADMKPRPLLLVFGGARPNGSCSESSRHELWLEPATLLPLCEQSKRPSQTPVHCDDDPASELPQPVPPLPERGVLSPSGQSPSARSDA